MTNSVTNRQMVFIIFLTLTTYSTIDLPKAMAETAGRSGWILIMIFSVLFGIAAVIITKLNNMYQRKVLFDYGQEIVGKFFTYLIGIYYLVYFLIIGIFLKLKLVGMLQSNFLPNTSPYVVLLFGILLFGYSGFKGITNIARAFEIIGISFIIMTVGICVFMIGEGMHHNIMPFYNTSDLRNYTEIMKVLVLPFGGIEILFVIPFTEKNKKASKTAFFTLFLIGLFYVLIVEGTLMILGMNNTIALNDSFVEAIKVIEMPIIERTDVFYLTFGLTSLFAGMTIIYTAVIELSCRMFNKVKRHVITIIIGAIFIVLSLLGLNIKGFNDLFASYAAVPMLISGVLIPTTLLTVAKLKKRAQSNGKATAE